MMRYILHQLGVLICVLAAHLVVDTAFSQSSNNVYLYNRQGDKIVYECQHDIFHIGLRPDISISERTAILDDLSSISNYYMQPDSSYCFIVNSEYEPLFRVKMSTNSWVSYYQNEYRDSLGGVVWGTNRIIVKMKPNCSIVSLMQNMNILNFQYESKWYDTTVYALVIPKDSSLFSL